MKKEIYLLVVFGILLQWFSPLKAQENSNPGVKWNGYLRTDNRVYLGEENRGNFSWQEYRLDLQADVKPTEKSHFYSEIWLTSWGLPMIQNSSDLTDKDKISPYGMDIKEAYVDIYGFLFNNVDIRIGRQRITWGTADRINPTDNLNPPDLEDLWDFGRHLGSNGIKMSCYSNGFTFTGAYIPTFTPAVLPKGDLASALSSPMELPAGMTLGNFTDTIVMPGNNFEEGIAGLKISKNLFMYDFSLSYVYGRDYLPLANKVSFIPIDMSGKVDISSELIYPKVHIAGADIASSIFSMGFWAEMAAFFPEEVEMTTDLRALGMGTQESIALSDTAYIKYVVGTDYTFKNNIYINGQYIHGFFNERGPHSLENYAMAALEWRASDDKIKITPIAVAAEIKDFGDIGNNYGIVFLPEIVYHPVDNAEIALGACWINGKNTTTFGRLKDNDETYLRLKYSF